MLNNTIKYNQGSTVNQWFIHHIKFLISVWIAVALVWVITAPLMGSTDTTEMNKLVPFLPLSYMELIMKLYIHPFNSITCITLLCGLLGMLKDFTRNL